MSIIINRTIQDNQWSHPADDEPLGSGDVTLTLQRWLDERESLGGHEGRVGLRLLPGDTLENAVPFVNDVELIALEFDAFTEGRGYSQARVLRERFGYQGELRALGARRDHVAYMERCGINAFEPASPDTAEHLLRGFDEITVRYQPSQDRIPLIFRERARSTPDETQETSA